MTNFVFTSPGIKFKETDLTFITRNIGITTLGLVGETLKGPAFQPIFISDKSEFLKRFGGQSIRKFPNSNQLQYQLPYVANAYLGEANQLYVTRVLGLSGYNAGKAWAVTLNAGLDPSTVAASNIITGTSLYTNYVYKGVTLTNLGDTGVSFDGFIKNDDGSFTGTSYQFIVTNISTPGNGTVTYSATTFTGTEYTNYKNMVLAVLRSRGYVVPVSNDIPVYHYHTNLVTVSGNTTNLNTGNLFGTFNVNAIGDTQTGTYKVSLNQNSTNFITNILGAEQNDKQPMIFVEAAYPDLVDKLDTMGQEFDEELTEYGISGISPYGYGINSDILECNSEFFTNYETPFKTPETPWVVSQLKGNTVDRLFRFVSISDGNAANKEIKISITNIDPINHEFDVVIRDFNDTDDKIVALETFSRCNLDTRSDNYVARKIGDVLGDYDLKSNYVTVEMADTIDLNDFPAGFEGYLLKNFSNTAISSGVTANGGIAPKIFYKQAYETTDNLRKTYLGISEKGYAGYGINQNLFNFTGVYSINDDEVVSHVKSNGFHMDIDAATITSNGYGFEVGAGNIQTANDILSNESPYYNILSRKFTFVPFGGFDGWDVYSSSRTNTDNYKLNGIFDGVPTNGNPMNDYQAWETAINTFSNPDEITINLFATPGINWGSNGELIKQTIDMVEIQRADTLYIIDAPDIDISLTVGDGGKADVIACQEAVDLLDRLDIDSSYTCTYFPHIQIKDTQNNINVYLPATGELTAAFAYTDNKFNPWFATAGLDRGALNARKSKYRLSEEAKAILYKGRINPIVDYPETGTAVMGQKTLQVAASKLDRINVRRLLLSLKVIVSNIATRLLFDPNDKILIERFKTKANPAFESIVRNRGMEDFYFDFSSTLNTPETRDRNELYGQMFIKPVSALEYIGIEFVITPTGASFTS